jgi:hypothetical protein
MGRPTNGYQIDGEDVPGVTTVVKRVCGGDPTGLMIWAAKEALKTGDVMAFEKARARAALVGTLTHELIESYLEHGETRTDAYGSELDDAVTRFNGWLTWWKSTNYELVEQEITIRSRALMCGGTLDALLMDGDGTLWLWDWKTGKTIKQDVMVQLAGYDLLLREETDYRPKCFGIINPTANGGYAKPLQWRTEQLETARGMFLEGLHLLKRDKQLAKEFSDGKRYE